MILSHEKPVNIQGVANQGVRAQPHQTQKDVKLESYVHNHDRVNRVFEIDQHILVQKAGRTRR